MRLSQIKNSSNQFSLDVVFFFCYTCIVLKAKGQQPRIETLELLAFIACSCSSAEKGATPGLAVKLDPASSPEEQRHTKRTGAGANPARSTTLNQPHLQR